MGGVFLLLLVFPSGTLSSRAMRRFASLRVARLRRDLVRHCDERRPRATAQGVRQPTRAHDERGVRRPRHSAGRRVPRLGGRRRGHRRAPLPPLPGRRAPAVQVVRDERRLPRRDGADRHSVQLDGNRRHRDHVPADRAAGLGGHRGASLPAVRDRRDHPSHPRLRHAVGAARGNVRRGRDRAAGAVLVVRGRLEPRDRRVDARRGRVVHAGALARPALRRPALLPTPLRRAAHARGLRRAAARAGRPRRVSSETSAVVVETMQPERISLWLHRKEPR